MKSCFLALLLIPFILAADAAPNADKPAADGVFIAVGYGGRRMSSRDGVHWENVQQWAEKGEDDSNNLISLAYGKGKFIAVGGGGWSRETQAGHILLSTDGAHWREVKKMQFRISPVMFDSGRFVAGGPSRQLLYSQDGETWAESPAVTLPKDLPEWAFWFRHGAAGNGTFIFTGNAGPKQKTWWGITTHDGKTIDSFSTDLPEVRSMVFGAGKFLIVSPVAIYSSTDGKAWEKQGKAPDDKFRQVLYTGKAFFLAGEHSTYTSADGITWHPVGKPAPCDICWTDGSLFIGTGWPGKMLTSHDGKDWTRGEQPMPAMGINQVVYGKVEAIQGVK